MTGAVFNTLQNQTVRRCRHGAGRFGHGARKNGAAASVVRSLDAVRRRSKCAAAWRTQALAAVLPEPNMRAQGIDLGMLYVFCNLFRARHSDGPGVVRLGAPCSVGRRFPMESNRAYFLLVWVVWTGGPPAVWTVRSELSLLPSRVSMTPTAAR